LCRVLLKPMVRVPVITVVWDAMLREAVKFIVNNTLGFLYGLLVEWTWQTLGGAILLASIVSYFYAWWEVAPLHNTTIIFGIVFLGIMAVALYRQKAQGRSTTQQKLAEIAALPTRPDGETLKDKLRQLYEGLEQETFWHWPALRRLIYTAN
jgi:hypothetical protein